MQTDRLTKSDTIDPVCGMRIDPHNAADRLCHEGREFYFCAQRCRQAFEADPQRYLSEGPKRKGIWRRYLERLNKATGGQPMSCH